MKMKMRKTTAWWLALLAVAAIAGAQEDSRRAVRVWDPYLAQWRVETPGRVWDPNLARYQQQPRDEVWDPYLAQYRPRDARRDPPAPGAEFDRRADGRHRHAGQPGWCFARH